MEGYIPREGVAYIDVGKCGRGGFEANAGVDFPTKSESVWVLVSKPLPRAV